MRAAVFSTHSYEIPFLDRANEEAGHELTYLQASLSENTVALAEGYEGVSLFVGDDASAGILRTLHAGGTRVIALRSAGFNHVDIEEADRLGMTVLRVPAYSPNAVAEHALALMMVLNRKLHRAFNRTREQNFELSGLMGFDMFEKTAGIIGTGKIGEVLCRILIGFGCRVLAHDPERNPVCEEMGVEYVELNDLYAQSDIISLHCPLTPQTHHLIDSKALGMMKNGVMLINTSRGGVIDTRALIEALKKGSIGSVGLDVYEEEGDLFFHDLSDQVIQDDVFVRLITFPNVLITAHQGFLTREACTAIAETTVGNLSDFASGDVRSEREVTKRLIAPAK
jgi:D-lactate dehydrogenase